MRLIKTLFASALALALACAALANPPTTSPEQGMFIAEEQLAIPNLANMATKEATAPVPVSVGDNYMTCCSGDTNLDNCDIDALATTGSEVQPMASHSAQGGHFNFEKVNVDDIGGHRSDTARLEVTASATISVLGDDQNMNQYSDGNFSTS